MNVCTYMCEATKGIYVRIGRSGWFQLNLHSGYSYPEFIEVSL